MRGIDHTTRRRVLEATGVAGIGAFLAGCVDDDNDTDEDPDPADENDEEPPDDDEPDEDEPDETAAIEPGTRIELDAQTAGWVGIEPEAIADEENPTLTLTEGESYEIGWEDGDGAEHNIEIRDEDDEVVDDLETEVATEGGDDQFLEFEASDEMTTYICDPHETTMVGDLEIEANGNGADEENGDGDEEDEENGNRNGDEEENGTDNGDEEEEEENGTDNGTDEE